MSGNGRAKTMAWLAGVAVLTTAQAGPVQLASIADLKKLSVEELMTLEVSTASRKEEKLLDTPAAAYVITRDDILRSGVRSLPEALRLAPGVEVARAGAHTWAITVRGFNGDLSNKLLVLIDGRSVYSPLYAGVFWDVQGTLLEDVEKIEVVSGPAGTMWGANAVNGVINIITRSAKDSHGGFAEAGAGNEEQDFAGLRYGGRIGGAGYARFYLQSFDRDGSGSAAGGGAIDDWRMVQGGFRADWDAGESSTTTLQGDLYRGEERGQFRSDFTLGTLPGPAFTGHSEVRGGNLLGRWTRKLDEASDLRLQVYYDHTERDIPGTYNEKRNTFDADFQHRFPLTPRNDFLWGADVRGTADRLDNTLFATFVPDRRTDWTFNAFAQDKIGLWNDRLFLTLGSKFSHNDYTGFEAQPNARLGWSIDERQALWASVSRAVRIPSRLDADLHLTAPLSIPGIPLPLYIEVNGNHDFDSEQLVAYEAGYRLRARENLSFDLAAFYNRYDDLQTSEPQQPILVLTPPRPYIILPNALANGMKGEARGATLLANWEPFERLRLALQYGYLDLSLRNKPGSRDASALAAEGRSPKNQYALHSFFDLSSNLSLFTALRHVGRLPAESIPAYTAVDASLAWQASKHLEASVTGQNLFESGHPEFGGAAANLIERSIYGRIAWRF